MRELLLIALCALLIGACVPPPEDVDVVREYDADENLMGEIQARGVLRVGVPDEDWVPFWFDPEGSLVGAGFVVAMSQELAAALGVDVRFVEIDQDYVLLKTGRGLTRAVDIAFAPIPTTESVARHHGITHPYWVGHQRLLVPSGSGIGSLDDVGGTSAVCSILDETTGLPATDVNEDLKELPSDVRGCARLLRSGDVEAVTAPDVVLMSVWAELTDCRQPCPPSTDYEIVGDELTTAGYGAFVPLGTGGWTKFVDATWAETDFEGDWMRFYEKWISPYGIDLDAPPEMRIEEAAGLFPS